MAVPKRRHSKARQRKRRTHHKRALPTLTECGNCGAMILTHNACHNCGYYRGEKVDHTVELEESSRAR